MKRILFTLVLLVVVSQTINSQDIDLVSKGGKKVNAKKN